MITGQPSTERATTSRLGPGFDKIRTKVTEAEEHAIGGRHEQALRCIAEVSQMLETISKYLPL